MLTESTGSPLATSTASSLQCNTAVCEPALSEPVGALLRERFEISDSELEQHIDDLAWSWRVAYARFEAHGIPADRDEALMLLHLHNRAVLSRSPAAQAARWAEIDRALDEGVNFFQAQGLAIRAEMERSR